MTDTIQYYTKEALMLDLEKVSDKFDTAASLKLPNYSIQDKNGTQYPAKKFAVMVNLINAIEGKTLINPKKSTTFRRKFMHCCWGVPLTPVKVAEVEVVDVPKEAAKEKPVAKSTDTKKVTKKKTTKK